MSEISYQFDSDCTAGRLVGAEPIGAGLAMDLTFCPTGLLTQTDLSAIAEGLSSMVWSISTHSGDGEVTADVIVQPAAGREKKLLVADMDSTMITVECIDELADFAGIKREIAAITEAAMRGELDFAGALDARVALLAGLEEGAIDRCLAERVRVMPGARELVRTMRARGAYTVLVSGGFTRFAEPVARAIGFDRVIANRLQIANGKLTGRVERPIVDAATKLDTLTAERARLGLGEAEVLAVGDGANDLPMIRAAGLGVAYRAKPIVAAAAGARVDHGDLTALLWAQGIASAEWIR